MTFVFCFSKSKDSRRVFLRFSKKTKITQMCFQKYKDSRTIFSESMKPSISIRSGHVLSFKVCKSCDAKRATAHFHKSTSESHSFNFLMCLTAWAWSLHCVWHMAASPRLSVKYRTLWSAKRVPLHCDYDGIADRRSRRALPLTSASPGWLPLKPPSRSVRASLPKQLASSASAASAPTSASLR